MAKARLGSSNAAPFTDLRMTALPNLLTMSRIAAIPLIVILLYFDAPFWRWLALALFAIACITDFFDGYLARSRKQVSDLGRFLDPIADKLLVAAVILVLVAERRLTGWTILPALIILCREILVSGLREYLAGLHVSVPVSQLAKWKTLLQMLALGFLILGDGGAPRWPISLIGEIGLWAAAALTLVTGYDYLKAGLKHM
jgi:CDP-diacylglycerol---glycerol-3-phosphate 3-phosphatidyltransferase